MFAIKFVMALLAASVVSAQTPPFSNTTATTSSMSTSATLVAPPTINIAGKLWKYDGCQSSGSNFYGLQNLYKGPLVTIELCLSTCKEFSKAGVVGEFCYCSNVVSDNSTISEPDSKCDFPCPGNAIEPCGGSLLGKDAPIAKRQDSFIAAGSLLTVYTAVEIIPVYVYYAILTTVYVSLCPTGPTTITYTQTQTLTHCGCLDYTPTATIPMTSSVAVCSKCGPGGGPITTTVTVPAAVVTGTGVIPQPPLATFTGGARQHQVAGALVAAGAMAAAML